MFWIFGWPLIKPYKPEPDPRIQAKKDTYAQLCKQMDVLREIGIYDATEWHKQRWELDKKMYPHLLDSERIGNGK